MASKFPSGKYFAQKSFSDENNQDQEPSPIHTTQLQHSSIESSTGSVSAEEFNEVYDCAKLGRKWSKVVKTLHEHPDWLTRVPDGRQWTILHQIAFTGNVQNLNEALETQTKNSEFRLLFKARDGKTILDVAEDRQHVSPGMLRRVKILAAADDLLNLAKDRRWEELKQFVKEQPDIVNEKPPYRRYYLAHHLAHVGKLDVFKELVGICRFQLDLRAENQTIVEVARQSYKEDFAEYVERLIKDEGTSDEPQPMPKTTKKYSPAFHDDACISFIPPNANFKALFSSAHGPSPYSNNAHYTPVQTGYSGDAHGKTASTAATKKGPTHNQHMSSKSYGQPSTPYDTQPESFSSYPSNSADSMNGSTMHAGHYPKTRPVADATLYSSHASDFMTSSIVQGAPGPATSTAKVSHLKTPVHAYGTSTYSKKPLSPSTSAPISESDKAPKQTILSSLTCYLTKEVFRDPVIAADGFTYERKAIIEWFKKSNHSPMTNEMLENFELKPNLTMKATLQALQESNALDQTNELEIVAADGFTYERKAIVEWFKNSNRSPRTNEMMGSFDLKPNLTIKSLLQTLEDNGELPMTLDKS